MTENPNQQLLADIAQQHGLPAALGARLRGETPDELVQDAQRLANALGVDPPPSQHARLFGEQPPEDAQAGGDTFDSGARENAPSPPHDFSAQLRRQYRGEYRRGDTTDVIVN